MTEQKQRISGDKLRAFIASAFEAVAIPRDDAKASMFANNSGEFE